MTVRPVTMLLLSKATPTPSLDILLDSFILLRNEVLFPYKVEHPLGLTN